MKIAVLKERRAGEPRVAATPDTVKKFVSAGHEVAVEADSGTLSGIRDGDFADAGAKICPDAKATLAGADLILKVRALMADEFELVTAGQAVAAQAHHLQCAEPS